MSCRKVTSSGIGNLLQALAACSQILHSAFVAAPVEQSATVYWGPVTEKIWRELRLDPNARSYLR